MQPYERFDAWKACHELILSVYRSTKHYPSDERYGLTSQTRRAAYSAAANIVEGSAAAIHERASKLTWGLYKSIA